MATPQELLKKLEEDKAKSATFGSGGLLTGLLNQGGQTRGAAQYDAQKLSDNKDFMAKAQSTTAQNWQKQNAIAAPVVDPMAKLNNDNPDVKWSQNSAGGWQINPHWKKAQEPQTLPPAPPPGVQVTQTAQSTPATASTGGARNTQAQVANQMPVTTPAATREGNATTRPAPGTMGGFSAALNPGNPPASYNNLFTQMGVNQGTIQGVPQNKFNTGIVPEVMPLAPVNKGEDFSGPQINGGPNMSIMPVGKPIPVSEDPNAPQINPGPPKTKGEDFSGPQINPGPGKPNKKDSSLEPQINGGPGNQMFDPAQAKQLDALPVQEQQKLFSSLMQLLGL